MRTIGVIFLVSLIYCTGFAQAQDATWQDHLRSASRNADKHEFTKAISDITKGIAAGFDSPEAYYHRGRWHFQNGDAKNSVADFDKFLELAPQQTNSLWERGISLYYTGDYKEGAEQFVQYQSYHNADVENAVWRYFCQQKFDSKQKCRKDMLPIEGDRRVGMMEIYRLFKGESTPEKVMLEVEGARTKGATKRNDLMHAHLYLSMFYDANGEMEKAKEHIDLAVKQFENGHYMWSVAVMHQKHLAKLAREKAKKKAEAAGGN